MITFILRRLLLAIPLLIAVSLIVFVIVASFPGDPCLAKLGQHPTEEALQACHSALDLDKPVGERYTRYMGRVARFEFGENFFSPDQVEDEILERLPQTFELSLLALLIAFFVGQYVGTRSALKPGSWIDAIGQVLSLGGVSIPVFWLGMLLTSLFCISLGWLPVTDWSPGTLGGSDYEFGTRFYFFESLFSFEPAVIGRAFQHALLPALALSTIPMATITRMTRSSMLEEVGKDYVTTARAKGLPEKRVIRRHVRRNAMIPVVTITGLQLGTLLSGAVLTETVFSWNGLGRYFVEGARQNNQPVVVGCILVFTLTFVVVNLVVDVLYHWIDPRIRDAGST